MFEHLLRHGPAVGVGHELPVTLVVGEDRRADLRAEAPSVELALAESRRIGREVPDRVRVGPRAAARKTVFARNGLIPAVAAVEGPHVLAQPLVQRRQGHALVVAAPDGDRRVVAQPLDLLHGVAVEGEEVVGQVGVRVEPEIVPYHDAVAVARLVELLVGGRTDPVADHVVVHLAVQPDLQVVLPAAAAEHATRACPQFRALDRRCGAPLIREAEDAVRGVVGVFSRMPRRHPSGVSEGSPPTSTGQVAGVEVRVRRSRWATTARGSAIVSCRALAFGDARTSARCCPGVDPLTRVAKPDLART